MPGGVAISRDVTLTGLPAELRRVADDGSVRPADVRLVLKDFSVFLAAKAKESFAAGRSPDGAPWAPLRRQRNRAKDRRAKRKGGGTGQKPLRDSGRLMASAWGTDRPGDVRVYGPFSLVQGTNVEYAGFHQDGTRRMVARPFLGITPKMADRLADIAADRLARQIAGGRGGTTTAVVRA